MLQQDDLRGIARGGSWVEGEVTRLTLSVLSGPGGIGPESRVFGAEVVIGRSRGCDWTLPDPLNQLSRRHCVLSPVGGSWHVADLSLNGTYVNDADAALGARRHELVDGDRLRLAGYVLEARYEPLGPAPDPGTPGASWEGGGWSEPAPPLSDGYGDADLPAPGPDAFAGPTTPDHSPAMRDAWVEPQLGPAAPRAHVGLSSDWSPEELAPPVPAAPVASRPAQGWPATADAPPAPHPDAPGGMDGELPNPAGSRPHVGLSADWSPEEEPDSPAAPAASSGPSEAQPAQAGLSADWNPEVAAPLFPATPAASRPAQEVPAAAAVMPPLPPNPRGGRGEDLLAAFLHGAGLRDLDGADAPEVMEAVGTLLRVMVGRMRTLQSNRHALKREFRIAPTVFRQQGNNPIKFSADAQSALRTLLLGRSPPAQAVAEVLDDMRLHELALVAAMQDAVRRMLAELAPPPADGSGHAGLLPVQRKARAYERYCETHARIAAAFSDDFDSVFGKAFARAYEKVVLSDDGQDRDGQDREGRDEGEPG